MYQAKSVGSNRVAAPPPSPNKSTRDNGKTLQLSSPPTVSMLELDNKGCPCICEACECNSCCCREQCRCQPSRLCASGGCCEECLCDTRYASRSHMITRRTSDYSVPVGALSGLRKGGYKNRNGNEEPPSGVEYNTGSVAELSAVDVAISGNHSESRTAVSPIPTNRPASSTGRAAGSISKIRSASHPDKIESIGNSTVQNRGGNLVIPLIGPEYTPGSVLALPAGRSVTSNDPPNIQITETHTPKVRSAFDSDRAASLTSNNQPSSKGNKTEHSRTPTPSILNFSWLSRHDRPKGLDHGRSGSFLNISPPRLKLHGVQRHVDGKFRLRNRQPAPTASIKSIIKELAPTSSNSGIPQELDDLNILLQRFVEGHQAQDETLSQVIRGLNDLNDKIRTLQHIFNGATGPSRPDPGFNPTTTPLATSDLPQNSPIFHRAPSLDEQTRSSTAPNPVCEQIKKWSLG